MAVKNILSARYIRDKKKADNILMLAGLGDIRLNELYHKQGAVNLISSVMSKASQAYESSIGSCKGCELRIYLVPNGGMIPSFSVQEMLVVHYGKGAYAARNATHNSNAANFREIGRLLDGGYYDEVKSLEDLEATAYRLTLGDYGRKYLYAPAGRSDQEGGEE